MQYRPLGKTDLTLSALTLGTMTWGEQNTEKEAHAQIDLALDAGINCLDAAEMYPVPPKADTQGRTEAFIGSWLASKQQRDRVIIATKITGPGESFHYLRNGTRLNREQVIAAADASLKRLQTDYIDLYQIHWPERQTNFFGKLGYSHQQDELVVPIEETYGLAKNWSAAAKYAISVFPMKHLGDYMNTCDSARHMACLEWCRSRTLTTC